MERTRPKNSELHRMHQHAEDLERQWHKRSNEATARLRDAQKTGAAPDVTARLEEEANFAASTASSLMFLTQAHQLGFHERMPCGGGSAIDVSIEPDNTRDDAIYFLLEEYDHVYTENEEKLRNRLFAFFGPDQARRVAYALLALTERKVIPHNFSYSYEHKR